MSVMITGGAIGLGDRIAQHLRGSGQRAVLVRDRMDGAADLPPNAAGVQVDLAEPNAGYELRSILDRHEVSAVIHTGALGCLDLPDDDAVRCYSDNVTSLTTVLEAIQNTRVKRFVFSSSASVYGDAQHGSDGIDVDRIGDAAPTGPHGASTLAGEWVLRDVARATDIRCVSLRCFCTADDLHGPESASHAERAASAHVEALDYLDSHRERFSVFDVGARESSRSAV